MFITMEEATNFIYQSYMEAQPYLSYQTADRQKRNPDYTKKLLQELDTGNNILITGSKGKGSVARMLSKLLQAGGKDVGLFTSPHVIVFNERIQRNDKNITEKELIACCNEIRTDIEHIHTSKGSYVSPIGIQCALALKFFQKNNVDVKIMECGKGVRYDDTRNLSRSYGVINPIFLEHTRELGKDLKTIAEDKGDLILPHMKAVYVAEQSQEVLEVLQKRAAECKVSLKYYGRDFWCEDVCYTEQGMEFTVITQRHRYQKLSLPLLGSFQAKNCALALALAEEVLGQQQEEKVRAALAKIKYPGRMEIISKNPLTILDACIHPKAAVQVKEVLKQCIYQKNPDNRKMELQREYTKQTIPKSVPTPKLAVVLAIPMDKDYLGTAREMSELADVILLTKINNPHYHFSPEQAEKVRAEGIACEFINNLKEARRRAESSGAEVICLLGTTAMITEVLTEQGSFSYRIL
ncbi:MAG: hypothetical protein K2M46_13690 [Lachnospiraceae bacterium]|nr:hypothetical protein [Lachnospiraceae bacterium]